MRGNSAIRSAARSAALVVLVAATAACGADGTEPVPGAGTGSSTSPSLPPTSTAPGASPSDGVQGAWTLDGVEGATVMVLADWPVTITFDGDQVGGRAACNSYGGTVDVADDGALTVGELSWTEMGCEPDVMALEQAFLAALTGADRISVDEGGERFVLTSGDSTWSFARQVPVPDASLTGERWVLDTYLAGGAATNMAGMDAAYLEFGADGTLSGSTACRALQGTWSLDGSTLRTPTFAAIDDPAAGVCADASLEIDALMTGVIESDVTVDITGRRLTLTAPGGEGLSFHAAGE